ncbi:hypothetical protein ABT275_34265 [Streptomyces sp. NPDC001185]|uniref:hypothetical protein n=1 Tax=Streptomyces sp. NPDC001185 TaxID=3154380 RepID=UPI00331D4F16
MSIYLGAFFALGGLVVAVGGIAAIAYGWVLPSIRAKVVRPRLYGWGVLVLAVGLFLMGAALVASTDVVESSVRTVAVGLVLVSSKVVRTSGRPAGVDQQVPDETSLGSPVGPDGPGDRQ